MHENVTRGEGEKPLGLLTMTKEVVPLKVSMVNVPATPTEDFLGRETSFAEKTILRWLVAFRYPEGVTVEEGDDWYVNVVDFAGTFILERPTDDWLSEVPRFYL